MLLDIVGSSPSATTAPTTSALQSTSDVLRDVQGILDRDVNTAADDVSIIYDVIRVNGRRPQFYAQHMQRFLNSLCSFAERQKMVGAAELMSTASSYCKDVDNVEVGDMDKWPHWFHRFDHAVRDVIAAQPEDNIEQNVKVIAWLGDRKENTMENVALGTNILPLGEVPHPSSRFSIAAFFITSTYPPVAWYEAGGGTHVALLYHAARSNPNAKIVQAPLRLRAAEQQKRLHAFESLLVHGPEDAYKVPEGTRSNLLCILETAHNEVAVVGSLDKDILVGVTLSALRQRVTKYLAAQSLLPSQAERALQLQWHQRDVVLADVLLARSLVMLGTSVGVLPISTVTVYERVGEGEEEDDQHVFRQYVESHHCNHVTVEVSPETGASFVRKQSTTDPVVRLLMELYREAKH